MGQVHQGVRPGERQRDADGVEINSVRQLNRKGSNDLDLVHFGADHLMSVIASPRVVRSIWRCSARPIRRIVGSVRPLEGILAVLLAAGQARGAITNFPRIYLTNGWRPAMLWAWMSGAFAAL